MRQKNKPVQKLGHRNTAQHMLTSPASTPDLASSMKLMQNTNEMDFIREEFDKSLNDITRYNSNKEDTRPATANPDLLNGKLNLLKWLINLVIDTQKKRIFTGIPDQTTKDQPHIPALKKIQSDKSLGTAYLLNEMCGLAGIDSDDEREDLEVGSDSIYHNRKNSGRET